MIAFKNVSLSFRQDGSSIQVADNFTLKLKKGDFTCILGPSGCGKTTLLNLIAGFHTQDEGEVLIDERPVGRSKAAVSYVFQGHNILPWKTVRQNIAFALTSTNMDSSEKTDRIEAIAKDVRLYDYLDSYPGSLSGGMKQRVGIARALICDPKIILMDEPFASLDALTAHKMRDLLKSLCKEKDITIIFVTHNIEEALYLGDRVIVVSQSPMKISIDKQLTNKDHAGATQIMKLQDQIYDTLKNDIGE